MHFYEDYWLGVVQPALRVYELNLLSVIKWGHSGSHVP